jgi:hypothetical protein
VAVAGLAAPLVVGLAFLGGVRRTGAFFARIFLSLFAFLRLAALALAFPLTFLFVATYSLLS